MNEPTNETKALDPPEKKNLGPTYIVIGILALCALALFTYWLFDARFKVKTQDAYVEGNIVDINPKISGSIRSVNVNNTDFVEQGQILATIDPTPYELCFQEAKAHYANMLREVQKRFDRVGQLLAALEVKLVMLEQKKLNFQHRRAVVGIGGVSKEDFENAQSAYLAAEAEVVQIQEELSGAEAEVYNTTILTHPLVEKAKEQLKQSFINLKNTQIKAPVSGFVAKKGAQVGQSAFPNKMLMSIVPLNSLWVIANLKEVQLSKVRIGQQVEIRTDIYKGAVKYQGKVIGIAPGTGSVFSVLPPQNATGNWIKIIQRVPVRIQISPSQLKESPLRAGLSCKVIIHTKDQSGSALEGERSTHDLYITNIFDDQSEGIEPIIEQIIQQNLSPCHGV